jgi:CheY-like chemotaxis protein
LADLGCSAIFAATSVSEALTLLAEHDFDAAMIDINLTNENSYPVADALAQRGIPFAFSTGYSDHGDRRDLESRPLFRKPYVCAALEVVFTQLLADGPLPAAA